MLTDSVQRSRHAAGFGVRLGGAMRVNSPRRVPRGFGGLAAWACVALCAANCVWAQEQPAPRVIPPKAAEPSQVFPDGGFPSTPPAPEGGIPATTAKSRQAATNAEVQPPKADYAPAGLTPREAQEGPGVAQFFHPISDPLPDSYFQPAYYDTPGIGARPLADYAPPGYQPRVDPQGEAPGVPEFTPITPPAPITPEERQKFVARGLFPGSFLVPGTDTSFRLRGFVRLVGLYDFNPIGLKDQ